MGILTEALLEVAAALVVEDADEAAMASVDGARAQGDDLADGEVSETGTTDSRIIVAHVGDAAEPEEEDGIKPLSDRLMTELTAFRTLALREAVGQDPAIAQLAVLHALCLKLFYRYGLDSCLEIEPKSVMFGAQAPGLADTPLAARVDARHEAWAAQLPEESSELWDVLESFDTDSRDALFAHCVSLTVNAVVESYNRRPKAVAHADRLAQAISLDLAAAGWTATVDNYLGRVSKARILEAVREAKGPIAAERIAQLKKGEMAAEAEGLLSGTGWLPDPLRIPGVRTAVAADETAIGNLSPEPDTDHSAGEAEAIAAE